MIESLRHPIRENFLSKAALALDLFLWLWSLPVLLRISSVPALLERLSAGSKCGRESVLDVQRAVRVVTLVCNLRPFRSRLFPKLCLRRSLALYRTLIGMGYPIQIHLGVRKDGKGLTGHSWVTMEGKPLTERTEIEVFKSVYSYSSVSATSRMK